MKVVPIVEGQGDVEAVPVLIRRVAAHCQVTVEVARPIRVARTRLLKSDEVERAVQLASQKAGPDGRVLILIDADDECPATLGPELARRAASARPDRPHHVVIAKREFEAWFIAAADSLRGRRSLALDLSAPADPEQIRGAKEWLGRHMTSGRGYRETVDQAALAAVFDLEAAREIPSFDKCYRELTLLVSGAAPPGPRR